MYKHIDRVRNLFLFFIELATWWVLVSESEWKFYYKWYKKTIMQSKECTNIRARPSRATHIPLPSLCVTHLFFISISVIKWLRISYAQFTVRQVRKSEDIETWIPACTVLPKAKIIAKRCNLINLIIGVDYKAFWKFSYWSDNFSVFFLNREYCHNSSAKQNTLSYIPFISNHMFGINWFFFQYAHFSIENVIFL